MPGAVYFRVEGLTEVQRALRKAGADAEALESVNKQAAGIIQRAGQREAPVDSGRLRKGIIASATRSQGKVIGLATVPYMGVIHFGWVTRNALGVRGQTRKQAQARYEGVLTKRAVNKALAGSKRRVNRQTGATRGAVRGGPIRPNPFLYRAAGDKINVDAVYKQYDEHVEDIARVFNR